jgi:hypothetical protein
VAFKEASSEVEGLGFFEDEVMDVGDGQARNMQQSSS